MFFNQIYKTKINNIRIKKENIEIFFFVTKNLYGKKYGVIFHGKN